MDQCLFIIGHGYKSRVILEQVVQQGYIYSGSIYPHIHIHIHIHIYIVAHVYIVIKRNTWAQANLKKEITFTGQHPPLLCGFLKAQMSAGNHSEYCHLISHFLSSLPVFWVFHISLEPAAMCPLMTTQCT